MTWPRIASLTLLLVLAACYHATIETGLRPGAQTLTQRWASGWIYGLVPPKTVEAMQRCPSGVARVETQLSFANQLVNFLTLGIYTPMEIVVTCAESGDQASAAVRDDPVVRNPVEFEKALMSGQVFVVEVR